MVLIFAVAFVGALLCVPLAAAVGAAVGGGLVDKPRPGEMQRRPISRTGGYGIVAAFFVALLVSIPITDRSFNEFQEYRMLAGLALGAAILVPFAAWDDAKRLPPLPQLVAQIVCALLPVLFGVHIDRISNLNIPGVIVAPLSVLWIVGMINALNWLDTMDGLAGGVSLIGAAVLFGASLLQRGPNGEFLARQNSIALLSLALAGACIGFLIYNFPPARIFMGTGGSMFLGYALGVISIIGGAKIATAVLVLGLPLLDTALVILQRILGGRSPLQGGDSAHLVHQMHIAGLSVRQIVGIVYTLTALFGMLSLFLVREEKLIGFVLVAAIVGGLLLLLRRRNAQLAAGRQGSRA
jgi:UDP-N-acetylmuramyl pentapeptide phosphotransferase/UDP-N-acetylglucosamine-1-phosphate transferase